MLQKDTSGEVYCFCPSCFAPENKLEIGTTILPQADSPMTSFPIEGKSGEEQILAIITPEAPSLQWLPKSDDEPLELNEHLQVAQSLSNLGNTYLTQGRYIDAEKVYQQAYSIRKNILPSEHPDIILSLHNFAETQRFDYCIPYSPKSSLV